MARHGAVAAVHLLDVYDLNGFSYHWASAKIVSAAALGITPVYTGTAPAWNAHLRIGTWDDYYLPWLVGAGPFHLARSMQTDIGNFTVQNVSGNTLQRDMNQLITASAFEGAVFAYREWNLDAAMPEFEFHGQLSIASVTESIAEFAATQLLGPSEDQGLDLLSETCRWRYASAACGDTTNNPCQQTFLTCRQPGRFGGIISVFIDIAVPPSPAVSTRDVQRRRQV